MWNLLHDAGIATWITAAIVLVYTLETSRMRKQIMIQNERAVMPLIAVSFPNSFRDFAVTNMSASPALNVSVDPVLISDAVGRMQVDFAVAYILSPAEGEVVLPLIPSLDGQPKLDAPWARNFFPHLAKLSGRNWFLTIRFQTIEGRRYKQIVSIRPNATGNRFEISPVQSDEPSTLERLGKWIMSDGVIQVP